MGQLSLHDDLDESKSSITCKSAGSLKKLRTVYLNSCLALFNTELNSYAYILSNGKGILMFY